MWKDTDITATAINTTITLSSNYVWEIDCNVWQPEPIPFSQKVTYIILGIAVGTIIGFIGGYSYKKRR